MSDFHQLLIGNKRRGEKGTDKGSDIDRKGQPLIEIVKGIKVLVAVESVGGRTWRVVQEREGERSE